MEKIIEHKDDVENWSFTEMQIYAKGYLNGIVIGIVLTFLLLSLGIDIYMIFKM